MRCLVPLLMTANHLFIRPLYFCLLSVSGLDIQRKPRRPDDCVRGLNIHPWNMQVLSSLRISLLYNVTTPKYCACHGKKHCFTISLANTSSSSPSKAGMGFYLRVFREWFSIRREVWLEPTFGSETFWVGVKRLVSGYGPVLIVSKIAERIM